MDLQRLEQFLIEMKLPSFRYRQIKSNYLLAKFNSFENMSDLPKPLRQQLTENFAYLSVKPISVVSDGKTKKALLELQDGEKIESVLMDYEGWLTVCVSSQVGCPLGCKFCATGKIGYKRNLTVEEYVDQIIFWNQMLYPKYVGRIVFMGMGEPFLNWDILVAALEFINSKDGLKIGARKMSVSTAGIVDKIYEFADLHTEINLAISLHSADQKTRQQIMPIANKYSLDELMDACNYYVKKTKRQIFFEYALMKGINDSHSDADKLIRLIKSNNLYYLNLIPLNPVKNGAIPSTASSIKAFSDICDRSRINYSFRHSFGQNLNAACGQLAADNKI